MIRLKDLKSILYSTRGNIQSAVVYDSEKNVDIVDGCSIDYVVKEYSESIVKRIEASNNQLIIIV